MTIETLALCRHCKAPLSLTLADLGSSPPSNAYLSDDDRRAPEIWYPLRVRVCSQCWLAQTEDHAGREALFAKDYAYFSSFSTSWLEHAKRYVGEMVVRFGLDETATVVEIASNDGYLLQYVKQRGIPCYGIEPTKSTATAAREKGIEVVEAFFGVALAQDLARSGRQADLMVANNVLAHVPDINDFVAGFSSLLKPSGVATFEFPHLVRLVAENQFDTIYHEHYSYLSLTTVKTVFSANGLSLFDVEELPTHGGSLRVFAHRSDGVFRDVSAKVAELLAVELKFGISHPSTYLDFQERANSVKNELLEFLVAARRMKKSVGAYGAAAKGNTLLNYAGVRPDLLPWVADRNPAKQGKFLPGSRIRVVSEEVLLEHRPDYVLILPWNLREEVQEQLSGIRAWGGKFVVAIPKLRVE